MPRTPLRRSTQISNFRHPMGVEAGADRFYLQPDYVTHVEEMIRQLLLTEQGERVMRPSVGTALAGLVFEPLRGAATTMIRGSVFSSLNDHLGDIIEVIAVTADVEDTTLTVQIAYSIRSHPGRRILNVETTT